MPPPVTPPTTSRSPLRRAHWAVILVALLAALTTSVGSAGGAALSLGDNRVVSAPIPPRAPVGDGNFRINCHLSHASKNDPIVFPGQPNATHLHLFYGNRRTNADSTKASIRTIGGSTCHGGTLNRSAYWIPALRDANGKPMAPRRMRIYYKSGQVDNKKIQIFPRGLRIVAGNAHAISAQENHVARWLCYDGDEAKADAADADFRPFIPTNCPAGWVLQMSVLFPQCWDGDRLTSVDQSHMAYPHNGKCPASHPKAMPQVSIHAEFRIPTGSPSGWHLSSDHHDVFRGQSMHADWFEGWNREAAKAFVEKCIRGGRDCTGGNLGNGMQLVEPQRSPVTVGLARAGVTGNRVAGVDPISLPVGGLSHPVDIGGGIGINGWAFDPNTVIPIRVHIFVNGQRRKIITADDPRDSFERENPIYGPNHGFSTELELGPGTHRVCIRAKNVSYGPDLPYLARKGNRACRTVVVDGNPDGRFQGVSAFPTSNSFNVFGWAVDPDRQGKSRIQVRLDGQLIGTITANQDRSVAPQVHRMYGRLIGFNTRFTTSNGSHTVCLTAIDQGIGSNLNLGCRNFSV